MNMEVTYHRQGDYLFPNLMIEDSPVSYWKYGMLRRTYLKENKKNWYQSMMLTGKLEKHLEEIDRTATERLMLISTQMAKAEGVTEQMKFENPMAWVAAMNSIQNRAEEIVLQDLIYS